LQAQHVDSALLDFLDQNVSLVLEILQIFKFADKMEFATTEYMAQDNAFVKIKIWIQSIIVNT